MVPERAFVCRAELPHGLDGPAVAAVGRVYGSQFQSRSDERSGRRRRPGHPRPRLLGVRRFERAVGEHWSILSDGLAVVRMSATQPLDGPGSGVQRAASVTSTASSRSSSRTSCSVPSRRPDFRPTPSCEAPPASLGGPYNEHRTARPTGVSQRLPRRRRNPFRQPDEDRLVAKVVPAGHVQQWLAANLLCLTKQPFNGALVGQRVARLRRDDRPGELSAALESHGPYWRPPTGLSRSVVAWMAWRP